MWQKRPMYVAKEASICGKRGLCMWQKRPIYVAKRGLYMRPKRPMYVAKEAYVCGKRDLERSVVEHVQFGEKLDSY